MHSLNLDNYDATRKENTEAIDDVIGFEKSDSDFDWHNEDTADEYCE